MLDSEGEESCLSCSQYPSKDHETHPPFGGLIMLTWIASFDTKKYAGSL